MYNLKISIRENNTNTEGQANILKRSEDSL